MSTAARALLTEIIDYAGLFPPARLELAPALSCYAAHRRESEAWMLARFIVPAARLEALAELLATQSATTDRLRLSVLFGGGRDRAAARDTAVQDLQRIEAFQAEHGARAAVEALETRLPDDVVQSLDVKLTESAVAELVERLAGAGLPPCDVAVEAPGAGEPAERDAPAVTALANAVVAGLPATVARLTYKVRCGGVETAAFPSIERLVRLLVAGREAGIALKATAGLHHPLRQRAAEPPVMMHGFLNFFGAGMLVHAAGADAEVAAACLAETDPSAFTLDDATFGWRGRTVSAEDVARIRSERMLGFGSCSFDEPRDDLYGLGLLD